MDGTQIFFDLVISAGVVTFAIAQWRNGRMKKTTDEITVANGTIDLLTKRADAFERELKEAKAEHQKNHDEIIRLQEALKHKDQLIDQYLKIITNRNPELEMILKDVRNFLAALNDKIGDGHKVSIT